jgi:CheY-like chemotaxis protein/nitrogen-specific signal transduction histidine kinase
MQTLLAALIPTLLLGFSILFLIVRLQNKTRRIDELEAKIKTPPENIIRREAAAPAASSEQEVSAPKIKTKPKPSAEAKSTEKPTYFSTSDSLLATLSHELKTPLNGIMGIAQMLREEDDENPQLIEMEGCAHHMHAVLHTLTNLARIQNENEFLPQYREWVSLRDTIEQIRQEATFRASGRQLILHTEHENNRIRLRGDSDHISTIINSAVLGSIEAVPVTDLPEEKQTLSIAWKLNESEVELTISNPLEVFEDAREQCVNDILHIAGGSEHSRIKIEYLHIAVAKALLGFYKGELHFEPLPSGGVRTTLRFTMEHMLASPSAAKPLGGLRVQSGKSGLKTLRELPEKLKILVAEDDRASRNLLIMLLKKMGQEATEVENGEQAVLALQQDPSYDLILMDVDMPVMDGMAATQAIRGGLAGDEVQNIPIVAVTAFNVLSDRSRFKEIGMQYYLPKPVGLKELRATLLEISKKKKEA